MSDAAGAAGSLALVGSGEYLPVMDETDAALLQQTTGAPPRVVVLPTASGLEEPDSPERWMRMGLEHFTRLGAHADAAAILTREDAHDPRWLPLFDAADVIYFSGGSPLHLVETMRDSPAWRAILARHRAGAALAGCSAGAMAFGGATASPGALRADHSVQWRPALGLLPRLIVLPHFDRLASYIGASALAAAVRAVPAGMTLIGVDEDTALVRLAVSSPHGEPAAWRVMGRQSVSLFDSASGDAIVYGTGDTVMLDVE